MKNHFYLLILIGTIAYGQRSDFNLINFTKADSIALKYKGASLKNLPILSHNLTSNLDTDVEKFRAIYTWVCTNIANDYAAYQKTIKKRKKLVGDQQALAEWNSSFTPKVFKKLVTQKKTACTGYAFLLRELANLADLKCSIINGYGRTATLQLEANSLPNHSWNAVELSGKWYLCDPTWSAGRIILEDEGARFKADYFDGYFLADPALFVKNHFPIETNWVLLESAPTFTTFIEGPVVYKEAFKFETMPVSPRQMHLTTIKNEKLAFTICTPQALDANRVFLVLTNGISSKNIQPKIIKNQDDYVLEYAFKKSGSYDVHIKIDEVIVATYVVKVRRK